jgi:hypothetical protein
MEAKEKLAGESRLVRRRKKRRLRCICAAAAEATM